MAFWLIYVIVGLIFQSTFHQPKIEKSNKNAEHDKYTYALSACSHPFNIKFSAGMIYDTNFNRFFLLGAIREMT